MNKSIIGAILVLIVVAGVGFVVLSGDDETATQASTTTTNQAASTESEAVASESPESVPADSPQDAFTLEEVATHSSETDCWTIVNQNVYDITQYIPRHPGGSAILQACGTDGTSLFTQRTTADGETVGSGTPHSGGASSQLDGFLVGSLAE